MLYFEDVHFSKGIPAAASILRIRDYPLHAHENIMEIVLVLQGTLSVMVSFERFKLKAGDYIVINAEDSHQMTGDAENITALLSFDLIALEPACKYATTVVFACESFDLAKYKKQEVLLREKLFSILHFIIAEKSYNTGDFCATVEELISLLIKEYAMESYYNRNSFVSAGKKEIYYRILKHLRENYSKKNPQEIISRKESYSKSYLSHLFKEVSSSSFADVLGYVRIAKSEPLILGTGLSISEISEKCGFSDVKYYNKTFLTWFGQPPFEYRRTFQRDISKPADYTRLSREDTDALLSRHGEWNYQGSDYQISINPLSLKTVGTKHDILKTVEQPRGYSPEFVWKKEFENNNCVLLPADLLLHSNGKSLTESVRPYIQNKIKPCICFNYDIMTKTECKMAARKWKSTLLKYLLPAGMEEVEFWITYSDISNIEKVNSLTFEIKKILGPEVRTILTP